MSISMLLALCLFLVSIGNAQVIGAASMTETDIDSTTFLSTEDAPNITGLIYSTSYLPMYHVLHMNRGIMLTLAYNISAMANATTLTTAMMIRNLAFMPSTNISAVSAAIAGSIGKVVVNVTETNFYGGATTHVDTEVSYVPGSLDSYGNAFAPGDLYGFDYAMFFSSPVANQNATVSFSVTVLNLVSW